MSRAPQGEEKFFLCCACGRKKFFRPLTPARFCDTLRDWGDGLPFPPSPIGAEGGNGAGFSFLAFLFDTP